MAQPVTADGLFYLPNGATSVTITNVGGGKSHQSPLKVVVVMPGMANIEKVIGLNGSEVISLASRNAGKQIAAEKVILAATNGSTRFTISWTEPQKPK